jgi:hypothetical protein
MPLIVCPCCSGAGTVDDTAGCDLTAMERKLFEIVQAANHLGIGGRALADKFYGDRIDGGPEHGLSCVHVQIHRANKKLATVGRRKSTLTIRVGMKTRSISSGFASSATVTNQSTLLRAKNTACRN